MVTFIRTDFLHPELLSLIRELDNEFLVRYPGIQSTFTPLNLLNERSRVVLAFDEHSAVACGAFRQVNSKSIEIKRMYTRPSHRNRGISKRILFELEQWAREEGFSEAILETGVNQPEAIAVYEKSGYRRIPNFPPYNEIDLSICYAKNI